MSISTKPLRTVIPLPLQANIQRLLTLRQRGGAIRQATHSQLCNKSRQNQNSDNAHVIPALSYLLPRRHLQIFSNRMSTNLTAAANAYPFPPDMEDVPPHFTQKADDTQARGWGGQPHVGLIRWRQDPRISKPIQDYREETEAWISRLCLCCGALLLKIYYMLILAAGRGNMDENGGWRPSLVELTASKPSQVWLRSAAAGFPGLVLNPQK